MTFGRSITEHAERRAAQRALNNRVNCTPSKTRATYAGAAGMVAVPKGPEPIRDESYRRLVAGLPCFQCGIHGYSNAAHPNSGKAKGVKLSDADCFPLCVDRPGIKGCHPRFDQYEIVSCEDMPAYELRAAAWTRAQLNATPTGETT